MKQCITLALVLMLILSACTQNNSNNTNISEPADNTVQTVPSTGGTDPAPTEHIHEYTVEQKDPTCTEDGTITHLCACGHSYSDPMPASGHTFGNWTVTVKPSMTTTGESQRECQICKDVETQELPVNTLEQECLQFITDMMEFMPDFTSVDALSGGIVFNWASWYIPQVSWEMDENYIITIVYSIDDLDAFTQKYLGKTFDYYYLEEPNKDFMHFDRENRQITVITGGMGGGGYNYSVEQLTDNGDNTYTLRYLAVDPYVENAFAQGFYHYGDLKFMVVDGHLQILSHSRVYESSNMG